MIDSFIDWLIDKAIKLGKGFLALVESGVDLANAGISRLKEWWRARTEFRNEAGEEHSIYIDGEGRNARVILKSDPTPYANFLSPKSKFTLDTSAKRTAYDQAVTISGELDRAIAGASSAAKTTTKHSAALRGPSRLRMAGRNIIAPRPSPR